MCWQSNRDRAPAIKTSLRERNNYFMLAHALESERIEYAVTGTPALQFESPGKENNYLI
jgi:hypothetical protein